MNEPLINDWSARVVAFTHRIRQRRHEAMALECRMLALTLFEVKKHKHNRKRKRWGRRLYGKLARCRQRLADSQELMEADALQPAVDCIGELIDLARELMEPQIRNGEEPHG